MFPKKWYTLAHVSIDAFHLKFHWNSAVTFVSAGLISSWKPAATRHGKNAIRKSTRYTHQYESSSYHRQLN